MASSLYLNGLDDQTRPETATCCRDCSQRKVVKFNCSLCKNRLHALKARIEVDTKTPLYSSHIQTTTVCLNEDLSNKEPLNKLVHCVPLKTWEVHDFSELINQTVWALIDGECDYKLLVSFSIDHGQYSKLDILIPLIAKC